MICSHVHWLQYCNKEQDKESRRRTYILGMTWCLSASASAMLLVVVPRWAIFAVAQLSEMVRQAWRFPSFALLTIFNTPGLSEGFHGNTGIWLLSPWVGLSSSARSALATVVVD